MMTFSKRIAYLTAMAGIVTVAIAEAQISTINSAVYIPRWFNEIPGATVNDHPAVVPGATRRMFFVSSIKVHGSSIDVE
jgi:hypothetical protein